MPEICGPAALFFDPKNPKAIAEKMLEMSVSQNLQTKFIAAGKKQLEKFSWEKAAQKTAQNFEKLF